VINTLKVLSAGEILFLLNLLIVLKEDVKVGGMYESFFVPKLNHD